MDLRVLQAVHNQFQRHDTSHSWIIPSDLFDLCLVTTAKQIPVSITSLISLYCQSDSSHSDLTRYLSLLQSFQHSLHTGGFSPRPAICLHTSAYPLESKLNPTSTESLQLEITRKLHSHLSGSYKQFKFFDTLQRGQIGLSELLIGVRKLGIQADEKELKKLLSETGEVLNLQTFSELFCEGAGNPASNLPSSPSKTPILPHFSVKNTLKSKRKIQLPSDIDPEYSYGKSSTPCDSVKDVISYTFHRDWEVEKAIRDSTRSLSPLRPRNIHTKTSLLRLNRVKQANKVMDRGNRSEAVVPQTER